ncbi:unnamed protein product [Schistosoma turkestanicum]|nr:unnamed protein product [Schistosoma turkestanicum]
MNENPIVICTPTSCPTISSSSCGSSFETSVCYSGIPSVAVPIVSGLSSNVLCSSALSVSSTISSNPPPSLSLTSLQNPVSGLNLNIPSSSHTPVILPPSASLLVHSINPSNNSNSEIHSISPITSSSLVINDFGNSNITVPMTCKNEFLNASIANSSFSYDSMLPVESSTICPNPNFSTIPNQTIEVIDPTQNLSSSISGSTPVTLALQSNMLNSNQMHSENVSSFNGESGIRPVTNPTLPPCFPLNLMPISPNGDFPAAQINFPGLPPVLLQVLPLPGVKMGEHYTINVPTQLIWDGISSALASGGTVNGGPIILSITPTPLPSHSVSSMSTIPTSSYTVTNQTPTPASLCGSSNGFINSTLSQVGVPVSTLVPYSTLSVGPVTTTVTTASVMSTKLPGVIINPLLSNPVSAAGGAKRMRAIAPKPSNVSSVATLGVKATSASTAISKSGIKRHGLVTAISSMNGIISNNTSLQSSHASIPNIGTVTGVQTPPKLLHSASRKVSLPLVNFSSSFVRSGRGRRRCAVGQQSVSTTFVTSAHASPICITNSVNSAMGISADTSNICSLPTPVSLPLSSPSALSSFYSTQPIFVPPTTNPGPVLPHGAIPPTFLFGNPLHNAPPITMPNGVAPFLFQSPLPISNSCSQFSNSVFSPATCTVSISPSTSCPLAVVRSLPSVSSATIFAASNGPTMASLDPATGLLTYYPSSCIPMNNSYPPTISSSDSSINISSVCSQPNQTMGLQPSSQPGPVMYPFQTQHLLSNQIIPTIFPNIPTDIAGANTFTDHATFLQSFAPSLIDSSCISSNVQISSESTIVQSQMACQNAFLTSAGNFHNNGNNGNIPVFPPLPASSITLPNLEVTTSICEANGLIEDDTCLAKDDLISLAWHLTQMEDDFEAHEKQNQDVLMSQTEDEHNGMFEDFLQVYSQSATAFNFNSDMTCQGHILSQSSVNTGSDVLDKDVILLDSGPDYRADFENQDNGTHLSCSNEESTGNADIDALLAAAAMVGAASGVGDAQSAVAVPLPSSTLASVTHQNALSSECDSSHPESGDNIHGDIHATFNSSLLPTHSTSCKLSPLLNPSNVEDSVDGLKETKPDDLLPSDLFDDFSKTEVNGQFVNETSDSVNEFDDGYEPTSLAAVLGCNAEDAANLESVLGQEAPDLSDGGGVSDSFLHSLVGPSPTVDDLSEQNNSVNIFDTDFHSSHEPEQKTENDLGFHSVDDFPSDIACDMVEDATNTLPVSRQVRSLLRDANAISVSSRFGSPPGGSKSFNHFFEATSRRLNRSCRFTSDIDDDFIGVDFSDAVNECTTAEQFDEALMLLGPQPNSPASQSEIHSENTIPVSVTDFVSHIEDKMKNNENSAKDKKLLRIDCTDLTIVEASDIQTTESKNGSPQHKVDNSVRNSISVNESTSPNEYIPPMQSSPIDEIKECTTGSGLNHDTAENTESYLISSQDNGDPVTLITTQSQQIVVDDDIIKNTNTPTNDDAGFLPPEEKTELVDLLPSILEEKSVSTNSSTLPSQDKPITQDSISVLDTFVNCHCDLSKIPVLTNSTYPVCCNLPRRPQSVSPKFQFGVKDIRSPEYSSNLPPRPQSLPNFISLSQFDIIEGAENISKSCASNSFSSCDIATSTICMFKPDIYFDNKRPCSAFSSDQNISVNTEDIVSTNISILGVLASSSALVEAVADLDGDSDISPIKSSIEGLASLDRMLKSCQRRSQQTLESTRNASSSSESAMVSSSQTSSVSQSSSLKTVGIYGASNSEFSDWKNIDVASESEIIHGDNTHVSSLLSVSSDHISNNINSGQIQFKNSNNVHSRRGRRKRASNKKPHLSHLRRNPMKTNCKSNPSTNELNASQSVAPSLNEFNHFQKQSDNYPTKEITTNDLLELAARRPHSFGLSSVDGELSNVPNPPIYPEFECHLPPLVLATGVSLFPESCLHSDVCSSGDDSCSTIPSAHKLKVEPDEAAVAKPSHDEDIISSSTPRLHTREFNKRKKRGRHINRTKPLDKPQINLPTMTEGHRSRLDFDKNNFIGVNPNFSKQFGSLDEAPFERFLHDTKLQTFAALKSNSCEVVPNLKSNFSSWCEPNQNVLLFGRPCDEQSVSGDCDSISTQNMDSENHFNDTRSTIEEVPESSSVLSSETNGNHIFDEPVSTSCESSKSSITSRQLVFSTPVSHTFNTLCTPASFCSVPKSHSPFQSYITPLPITTAVSQSNSLCDSSSSTSHSLEKVFPTVSPLLINRNVGITGSFAGAAAFRATSFSALAAKVEKNSVGNEFQLNNTPETLWRNVTFADLAKSASSESKSKETSQTITNVPSSFACNSSWFVDKSLQIDASALQPKPLFQPNFLLPTSSKSPEKSTLLPATIFTSPQASPNHFHNQPSFNDSSNPPKSPLSKSSSPESFKKRLKCISSLPRKTNRRKRSAGKRQRRPRISFRKSNTKIVEHNSNDFYTEGNNFVPSTDNISNHLVTTVNNEAQHHCSDSKKPSVDEHNKSENILSSSVCLTPENTNAPSDSNVVEYSTSPTIIMNDLSVIPNVPVVVVDSADKDDNRLSSVSPIVLLPDVNCEQSLSVPVGVEDYVSHSKVVTSVSESLIDPLDSFVHVRSENATGQTNSPQPDVLQDKNVDSLYPDSSSKNIVTDNDDQLSHPPIKLRLNLKLAALKSKSKKKKRKKIHFVNPVSETKSNSIVEMTNDPPNRSLSIRLVNKIPIVKEISKSGPNNSSRKRKKKSEKTSIHCKGPRNLTIIMDSNLQCQNPPKTLRLDETSSPIHNVHITQSSQAVPSVVLPGVTLKKNTPVHPLSTKKIFSTARQERRSNYAQLARPWRANLSTSPRKRSTAVSTRRHVASVTRSHSRLISASSGASSADHKQLNVTCAPENVFAKKASNDDVDNCCDNSQSYSITNFTGVQEIPKTERPESHPLRLIIRLGKPVNPSKEELFHQPVISPVDVQVSSDISSNSSQASNDIDPQDENVNFPILSRQSNVKNDSSVEELTEFCVASEAETFMDPNQFQIHRILNRALPMSSGLVGLYIPSPNEDDDNGDGCGMVGRTLDSEHRFRMTDQSFHFSQACHENRATPVAPQIGCTAGLSSRKEVKPLKNHRRSKKSMKSTRYRYGRHKSALADEHSLDQSSKLHVQCMKNFEKHCVLENNNDLDFFHDQPSHLSNNLSIHSTNVSESNSVACDQIYNPSKFTHSSPEPMNPAQITKCNSEGKSDSTQMKFLWSKAYVSNLNIGEKEHPSISALSRNEEMRLNNSYSSNGVTIPSDHLNMGLLKCDPKFLIDENNMYSDPPYSQQAFCSSVQTRVFEVYNNGSYTNGSSGSGFGGSCSHTGSANSIPAPSTGSPAPLSLGPAPGSQPEYSSNCTGSLNESLCGPLSPLSVNRDFHCSPVSSRFDLSAPIYLETQPVSHIPYSQCHESRISGSC